ncbi:cell wall hydrolase [Methylorubrum sp. POS3]
MSALRTRRVRGLGLGPRFIVSAVVPWMLASGLLISFTATAGTDTTMPPERLYDHDVTTTGGLPSAWTSDMIAAGIVATPDSTHDSDPDDGTQPSLADSDGSTPAVPRAVALSSVTPAPADATPIEVAAGSLVMPGFSPRLDRAPATEPEDAAPDAKHRYADLIGPEAMDKEQRCLAEAVYFEARSEPEEGQAAVAQVVLNRVKSGLYPQSVCGVVYQNRHRFMGCQFSFACEGKSLRITDAGSWQTATRIASAVIEGRTYLSEVGGATHYHADYVKPGWSRRLKRKDMIGRHIFYQLKPNQT